VWPLDLHPQSFITLLNANCKIKHALNKLYVESVNMSPITPIHSLLTNEYLRILVPDLCG
jgi:hypothetical protein